MCSETSWEVFACNSFQVYQHFVFTKLDAAHTHTHAHWWGWWDPAPVQWGHHLQSGSWSHWCQWQKGWEYLTLCPGVLMFKTLGCLKNRNKDTCGMCIEKEPDRTVKKFTSMCLLICPRLSISLYIPFWDLSFSSVCLLTQWTHVNHPLIGKPSRTWGGGVV